MSRLHVHIGVTDLARSTAFYRTLFDAEPTVEKDDYVKWELQDPAVNFAISQRDAQTGVDHVGIQADSPAELEAITKRLHAADEATFQQEATTCCYAVSDKTWVEDPSGVRWETFFTHGDAATYGADASKQVPNPKAKIGNTACCSA